MSTFADLNFPFPLFQGAVIDAEGYAGFVRCSLCGQKQAPAFHLGVGDSIIRPCASCGFDHAFDADEGTSEMCAACGRLLPFLTQPRNRYDSSSMLVACYQCLRGGRASIGKDTVVGPVDWAAAQEGLTLALPERPSQATTHEAKSSYETSALEQGLERVLVKQEPAVAGSPDYDWVATRVPRDHLLELLRTPTHSTNQGSQWLFCCQQPMIFLGNWNQKQFNGYAPDGNGRALFDRIVPYGDDALWRGGIDALWRGGIYDCAGIYVFRCAVCGKLDARWDFA